MVLNSVVFLNSAIMGSVIFNLQCIRKPFVGQSLPDPLGELTAFPAGSGEGAPGRGQGRQVGDGAPDQ